MLPRGRPKVAHFPLSTPGIAAKAPLTDLMAACRVYKEGVAEAERAERAEREKKSVRESGGGTARGMSFKPNVSFAAKATPRVVQGTPRQ